MAHLLLVNVLRALVVGVAVGEPVVIGSHSQAVLSVYDRDLVTLRPSYGAIINNHNLYDKDAANEKHTKRKVLAYVTPWNNHGYDIVKWFRGKFTHISPVWYNVKVQVPEGFYLTGEHDVDKRWVDEIRKPENGVSAKVVPRFVVTGWTQEVFTAVIQQKEVASTVAGLIISEVREKNFDGIVFETQVPEYLQELIQMLSRGLHKHDKELYLVIGPKRDDSQSVFSEEHFNALAPYVDGFSLMTYDYSSEGPSPSSPLSWVEDAVFHISPELNNNRDKILLGLNLYGTDWADDRGSPITGKQYLDLLRKYKPKMKWEKDDMEHYFNYVDESGTDHEVYYPTLKSLESRISLSEELGCGISLWETGQGLDYFYELL